MAATCGNTNSECHAQFGHFLINTNNRQLPRFAICIV